MTHYERDQCEDCGGKRGGVPGNENVVNGRVLCDYCTSDALYREREMDETIVHEWPGFYLRDDRATGIREDEAYSLFRLYPYGREMVYAGSLAWAIRECDEWIKLHGDK